MQENQQTRAAQRILGAARRSRFAHLERGGHVGSCDDDMYERIFLCVTFDSLKVDNSKSCIAKSIVCFTFDDWDLVRGGPAKCQRAL